MPSFRRIIQQVLQELNQIRTNPKEFAERMEESFSNFKENKALHRPGAVPVMTREGIDAAKEALEQVKNTEPMEPLEWSIGLGKAAQSHVNDTGPLGIVGHIGSRENSFQDRLEVFGKWNDCIAEALDYGSVNGFEVVLALLVDDGLPTRPHRQAILNPRFRKVGVGVGPHSEYRSVSCVVFAGEFSDKEDVQEVDVPSGGVRRIKDVENWLDGAVKLTCETRTEFERGTNVKKVKKYWEMSDGSTQVTEETANEATLGEEEKDSSSSEED